LADLTAQDAANITGEEIENIHRDDINRLPAEHVSRIKPAALAAMREEQVIAMTSAQVKQLTQAQREVLDSYLQKRKGESKILRQGKAIKPGMNLLGDAYSQLVDSANGDIQAQGSFGGGLEAVTRKARAGFIVRKGTQPTVLTRPGEFGSSLLTPQNESFYFGLEAGWWRGDCSKDPKKKKKSFWRHWFRDGRKSRIRVGHLISCPGNSTLGLIGSIHASTVNWQPNFGPAIEDDPLTGENETRSAADIGSDVTILAIKLQPSYRFLAADGENYVEITGFLGPSIRWGSIDAPTINEELADKQMEDDRFPTGTFLKNTVDADDLLFFGAEGGVSMRINEIVITGTISLFQGDTQGLSGVHFIPALTLRTGAQLIEFDDM
jgi:hypothetical protein